MEEKLLIQREQDANNRRKNSIRITEAGRASVSASMHIYDNWFSSVCACLSEEEYRQLGNSIDRMIDCALRLREQAKGK